MLKYFATCPKGLESLLRDELLALGAQNLKETVAGVSFSGELEVGLKACLWTRFSTRILLSLATYHAESDLEFYMGCYSIRFENYFDHDSTIAVDFNGQNDYIRNTQYGALRIKDAICDRFVKEQGFRPNVDRVSPDIRVNAHLDKRNNVTISLDLSGKPLHQREYRTSAGTAPLKENLAAAIVKRSAYNGSSVVDPMCGSGTLLIEAALQAADTAPGLFRHQYGFYKLKQYDASLFAKLKYDAEQRAEKGRNKLRENKIRFVGFDMDAGVLERATENIKKAGLSEFILLQKCELHALKNPFENNEKGLIVCNPPYGERLGNFAELLEVYAELGNKMRTEFSGWKAGVISSSVDLLSSLRLRPRNRYHLYNGALSCELRTFDLKEQTTQTTEVVKETTANENQVSAPVIIAEDFANRLKKNIAKLSKWAKREGLEAYRIYDADLPDYAAAIDRYGDYIVIQEYAAPKNIPAQKAHQRLLNMISAVVQVTGVAGENVILKVREKKRGDSQYEKIDESRHTLLVKEYGISFVVNLWDYLDTGLFLDHRLTRKLVGKLAEGKNFLNVFAYTGSATVYAATHGALSTTTVDMSRTYLNWAKENLKANGIHSANNTFVQADCLKWIKTANQRFDLIFADPPTFSNSKRMEETFDVQRDHVALLKDLCNLLTPHGQIVFSNNSRNFVLDEEKVKELNLSIKNLSSETLQEDFKRNKKIHCCWLLTLNEEGEQK